MHLLYCDSLPPKLETKISCPMTEMQKFWMQRLLLNNSDIFESIRNSSDGSMDLQSVRENSSSAVTGESQSSREVARWQKLSSLFAQLRKCANHPYLFDGVESVSIDGKCLSQVNSNYIDLFMPPRIYL